MRYFLTIALSLTLFGHTLFAQAKRVDDALLRNAAKSVSDGDWLSYGLTPGETPYWIGICPLTSLSIRSIRILWPSSREPLQETPPLKIELPEGVRRFGHLTIVDGGKSLPR